MGVKMGWIQIKMGHPLAQNGAALAPFRANGAHPSSTAEQSPLARSAVHCAVCHQSNTCACVMCTAQAQCVLAARSGQRM